MGKSFIHAMKFEVPYCLLKENQINRKEKGNTEK
jgi:hypothetical protein